MILPGTIPGFLFIMDERTVKYRQRKEHPLMIVEQDLPCRVSGRYLTEDELALTAALSSIFRIRNMLDNNESERLLHTPVVGRKNFYGSGARWSGEEAAMLWTIFATAQMNGAKPHPFPDRPAGCLRR